MKFKLKYIVLSLFIAGGCGFNALLNLNGLGPGVVFASEATEPEAVRFTKFFDEKIGEIRSGNIEKIWEAADDINKKIKWNTCSFIKSEDLKFNSAKTFKESIGSVSELEAFGNKTQELVKAFQDAGLSLENGSLINPINNAKISLRSDFYAALGGMENDKIRSYVESSDFMKLKENGNKKAIEDLEISVPHGEPGFQDKSKKFSNFKSMFNNLMEIFEKYSSIMSSIGAFKDKVREEEQQQQQASQANNNSSDSQNGLMVVSEPNNNSSSGEGQSSLMNVVEGQTEEAYKERIRNLAYRFSDYMSAGKGFFDNRELIYNIITEVNSFREKYKNDAEVLKRLNGYFYSFLPQIFDSFKKLCEEVVKRNSLEISEDKNTIIPQEAQSLGILLSIVAENVPNLSEYRSLVDMASRDLQDFMEKSFFENLNQQQQQQQQSQSQNQNRNIYDLADGLRDYCHEVQKYVLGNSFDNYGTFEMSMADGALTTLQQKVDEFVDEYEKLSRSNSPADNNPVPAFESVVADFRGSMRQIFDNLRDGTGFFAIGGNNLTKAQAYGDYFSSIKQKLLDIYSKIYPGQSLHVSEPVVVQQTDKIKEELEYFAGNVSDLGLQIFSKQNGQNSQNIDGLMSDFFGSFDAMLAKLNEVGMFNAAGTISYFEVCKSKLSDVLGIIRSGNFATEQIEDYMSKISELFSKFFGFDPQYSTNAGFYEEVLNKLIPPKVLKEREEQIKNKGLTKEELEACGSLVKSALVSTNYLLKILSNANKVKNVNGAALDELHRSLSGLVDIFKKYYPENVKGSYVVAYNSSFKSLENLINMAKTETGLFADNSIVDEESLEEIRSLLIEFYKMNADFAKNPSAVNDPSAWYNKKFRSGKKKAKEIEAKKADDAKKLDKLAKKPRKRIRLSRSRLNSRKKKESDKKDVKKTKGKTKSDKALKSKDKSKLKDKDEEVKDIEKKKKKKKKKIVKRKRYKFRRGSRLQNAYERLDKQKAEEKKKKKAEEKKKKLAEEKNKENKKKKSELELARSARSAMFSSIANLFKRFQKRSLQAGNFYLGTVYDELVEKMSEEKERKKGYGINYSRIEKILKQVDKIAAMLNKMSKKANGSRGLAKIRKYRQFVKNEFLPLFMSEKQKKAAGLNDTKTGLVRKFLDAYKECKKKGFNIKKYDEFIELKNKFVKERGEFFDKMNKVFKKKEEKAKNGVIVKKEEKVKKVV